MTASSDTVIERARVREAAGVFRSYEALDAAVASLLQAGFDRADIDVIGDLRAVRDRLGGVYVAPEDLADVPLAPRRPYFAREDVAAAVAVIAGTLASIGGIAVAFGVVATGGRTGLAIGSAAVAAVAVGSVAAGVVASYLGRTQPRGLEWLASARGLILWVRALSTDREDLAEQILREHGAEAVRIHEVEIEKRADDIPLSSLRPDPWIGERLGQM
jgi:hypothetical protein